MPAPDSPADPADGARPGFSWSRTIDLGPGPLHAPSTAADLQALVGRSQRIRALGTRHSFSAVAASDADLVTLERMPEDIEIDTVEGTVRVGAGVRYGTLAVVLAEHGLALENMGSLPHISVGGASATGTHGSGNARRSLSSSVRAVELVTADGDLLTLSRDGDPDVFAGVALSLGVLGVATHLVLDLVPAYSLRQAVYLDVPREVMDGPGLVGLLGGARSVSLFHHWDGRIDQIWAKQEVTADGSAGAASTGPTAGGAAGPAARASSADGPLPTDPAVPLPQSWHGARRASAPVHPVPGMPATFCTDQSGMPGPWFERLPHFRMEFTPSSGEETQSEYFVPREMVADAVAAVSALGERIRPLLHVSEIRTVAADALWLSPAHERDSACIHFTWKREPEAVRALLPEVEAALAPFGPRPHWGKVFTLDAETVQAQYPRLADFQALRDRLDPTRVLRNDFVDRLLGS